jgi:hypothetical protein
MSNAIYDEYTEQFFSYFSSSGTKIDQEHIVNETKDYTNPNAKEFYFDNTKFIPENNDDLTVSYNADELAGCGISIFGASVVFATFIAALTQKHCS